MTLAVVAGLLWRRLYPAVLALTACGAVALGGSAPVLSVALASLAIRHLDRVLLAVGLVAEVVLVVRGGRSPSPSA